MTDVLAEAEMAVKRDSETGRLYELLGYERDRPPGVLDPEQKIDLLIEIDKRKKHLEGLVGQLERTRESIAEDVRKHFEQLGQTSVSRRGMTLYIRRDLWPKIDVDSMLKRLGLSDTKENREVATEKAKEALLKALASDPETAHLVFSTFNYQSVRSYMLNDMQRDEEDTPIISEHLAGLLTVSEDFKPITTKSSRK